MEKLKLHNKMSVSLKNILSLYFGESLSRSDMRIMNLMNPTYEILYISVKILLKKSFVNAAAPR